LQHDEALQVHEIGWKWFSLHAQQRMQIMSYWFVAMSFLTTGAVLAYNNNLHLATAIVCLAIALASVLFLLYDLRTRELIAYGERLMELAEQELSTEGIDVRLVGGMHASHRRTVSYRTLFSALYGGAALLAILSSIASLR
jgi:hypothetical protein